jgi:hypothetical protein
VDFGQQEAFFLVNSNKFSEKYTGYASISKKFNQVFLPMKAIKKSTKLPVMLFKTTWNLPVK